MRNREFSFGLTAAAVALAVLGTATRAGAQQEKVLHSFNFLDHGGDVIPSGLIFDAAGNLYGTAASGGSSNYCDGGCGTVFELVLQAGGGWKERVLHTFGKAGNGPIGSLIFDPAGNLYGTASLGGLYNAGTVYELMPTVEGEWAETVLHNFNPATDGEQPLAGLVFDGAGNLYGTTSGTVFELTPQADGSWKVKTLHTFDLARKDGFIPTGGLTLDAFGNLYGTTAFGGAYGSNNQGGIVFELTPTVSGSWTEKILHNFYGSYYDGNNVDGGVIFDSAGNLYGTAALGGAHNSGIVYELTPTAAGSWKEHILYAFQDSGGDARVPSAGVTFDAAGNLYGTTTQGGISDYGAVFELEPGSGGNWTETVLHKFSGPPDGQYPVAGIILDASGNLYSTTESGGAFRDGSVFEIKR
jgi:uncharacterized repeat protein (TIGR03803 family)